MKFVAYLGQSKFFPFILTVIIGSTAHPAISAEKSVHGNHHDDEVCQNNAPDVFYVKFDENATIETTSASNALNSYVESNQNVRLYAFIHGWGRPINAETDPYDQFLCKLRLRVLEEAHAGQSSAFVYLLWPATITPEHVDPAPLRPASYFTIKKRADIIARKGISRFLHNLSSRGGNDLEITLIGHSFGGRMLMLAITSLWEGTLSPDSQGRADFRSVFPRFSRLQLIMLNSPVSRRLVDQQFLFGWSEQPSHSSEKQYQVPVLCARLKLVEIISRSDMRQLYVGVNFKTFAELMNLQVINVYSRNDYAAKVLFPISSPFTCEYAGCGVGGCGAEEMEELRVDASGNISIGTIDDRIVNVDASAIIANHTDIFSDRVSEFLHELMKRPLTRELDGEILPENTGLALINTLSAYSQGSLAGSLASITEAIEDSPENGVWRYIRGFLLFEMALHAPNDAFFTVAERDLLDAYNLLSHRDFLTTLSFNLDITRLYLIWAMELQEKWQEIVKMFGRSVDLGYFDRLRVANAFAGISDFDSASKIYRDLLRNDFNHAQFRGRVVESSATASASQVEALFRAGSTAQAAVLALEAISLLDSECVYNNRILSRLFRARVAALLVEKEWTEAEVALDKSMDIMTMTIKRKSSCSQWISQSISGPLEYQYAELDYYRRIAARARGDNESVKRYSDSLDNYIEKSGDANVWQLWERTRWWRDGVQHFQ